MDEPTVYRNGAPSLEEQQPVAAGPAPPVAVDFDALNPDNIEDALENMRLFDEAYNSDEDCRDKVRLTSRGIDVRALKAGQNVEFDLNLDDQDDFNWEDEEDYKLDYEKIYRYRNMDMVTGGGDEDEPEDSAENLKTPFEKLRLKMFDVTQEKTRGVLKRVLQPGVGPVIPNGSLVRIHYNAYFEMNDEPFDSTHLRNKTFEFKLGANQVVIGLDIGVSTMRKHEKSQFIFEPYYYCGENGCEPRVPRETPVLFEVEVISYIQANAYDEYQSTPEEQRKKLSVQQMLIICNCLRELGNDNYRRMNYREASKKYRKAIYLLENTNIKTEEEEAKIKAVSLKVFLNMSQICLKQAKPKKAIFYCKSALDLDPGNIKATFRYGQSLRILKDFERARQYLVKAYKMNPTDKDIQLEINKLNDEVAQHKLFEKDFYKKMFNFDNGKDTNNNEAGKTKKPLVDDPAINQRLNEFVADKDMKVYTIQTSLFPPETLDYLIKKAKSMKLTVRTIKGTTETLQIMKE